MKIFVIKNNIHVPSANVINTLKHAQGFSSLGHEVEILTSDDYSYDKSNSYVKDIHSFHGLNKKIEIKHFPGRIFYHLKKIKYIGAFILYFLKFFPVLSKYIDPEIKISEYCIKNKIDLAFCRDTIRTAYNNIINRIPTVLDLHGLGVFGFENLIKLRDNKYFKGIVTLNNNIKQDLIKKGFPKEKIAVMENGIDLDKFDSIPDNKMIIRKNLNLPLDKIIILYSGVIGIYRGVDTIIEAANILNSKKYAFYFLGGGTKKHLNLWKNYIIENNINANINFLGLKPKKKVPYYLKASDILLATFSIKASTNKYMSPVKIIEYMASKTPFIATRIGRIIKMCDNNECLLVNPEDPIDLGEKINLLLSNEDLRKELINNAYNKAKNHTIQKRCNKFIELSLS